MYIFDTNAVYYLVDEGWTSKAQLAMLQEKADDCKLDVALSPITVLEMSSRIAEESGWFDRVRAAAVAFLTLKPSTLPDPEQRMREIVSDQDLARQAYEHWHGIVETIARAPSSDALQRGFNDYGTATRRSTNILEIARFPADYEEKYVDDMFTVVRQINSNFDKQVGSVLAKSFTGQVICFLGTNNGRLASVSPSEANIAFVYNDGVQVGSLTPNTTQFREAAAKYKTSGL